ncbi:GspH/FimT family pseudopilin [Zhongshania sp. BJYM1]|uniref:GspH/FimT family pseudopilin n=1 Tax=Zhongshania aquatica TaxID=2965069 RepID=UPI0022B2C225|nr:GspH/FimT family pseudopilin [Marortus sp. BJYM1]
MRFTSKNRGFTLIELIVTVSIAAILAVVAVPSFTQFIDESRDRAMVQQLMKALITARSEAVVRAAPVTVSAIDGNWAKGWLSWVDANANGSYDDGEALQKNAAVSSSTITGDRGGTSISSIAFNSDGFLNDTAAVVVSYRTSPEYCSRDRNINISLTGQVSVTERSCP